MAPDDHAPVRGFGVAHRGRLAIIEPDNGGVVLLGPTDGVPDGATRLLYEPVTGTIIFCGQGIGIAARHLG